MTISDESKAIYDDARKEMQRIMTEMQVMEKLQKDSKQQAKIAEGGMLTVVETLIAEATQMCENNPIDAAVALNMAVRLHMRRNPDFYKGPSGTIIHGCVEKLRDRLEEGKYDVPGVAFTVLRPGEAGAEALINQLVNSLEMVELNPEEDDLLKITKEAKFSFGTLSADARIRKKVKWERALELLARHLSCDWGMVEPSDSAVNDAHAARDAGLIFSIYAISDDGETEDTDNQVYVITDKEHKTTKFIRPQDFNPDDYA